MLSTNPPIIEKLNNGLRVCFVPSHEGSSVFVQLRGLAGSNYESKELAGTAHLLEHLALKGTKRFRDTVSLTNLITNGGGRYIGITSRDDILFGTHILSENLEQALIFLSQLFYFPLLRNTDLDSVKETAKNEISRYYDNPEKLTIRLAYSTMFPNTRLEIFNTGSYETLKNITIKDIKEFHKRLFINSRFVLVICGNFDVSKVRGWLKKYFATETDQIDGFNGIEPDFKINEGNVVKTFKMNFKQNYMHLAYKGYKFNENDKYYAMVLAKCLSAGLKRYVQDKGLAYLTSVDAFSARNYGFFSFFAGFKPDRFNDMRSQVFKMIENVDMFIDKQQIETSKKQITANLIFALERLSLRADFYSENLLHGNAFITFEEVVSAIQNISAMQVAKAAKEIFSRGCKLTLILNDTIRL